MGGSAEHPIPTLSRREAEVVRRSRLTLPAVWIAVFTAMTKFWQKLRRGKRIQNLPEKEFPTKSIAWVTSNVVPI